MLTLTSEQQDFFNQVEETSNNYLIQGEPGTGKSVLINAIATQGRKTYTLAAPTGLAALNINGRTLHSIFRIPVSEGIIHPTYNKFPTDDRVIANIKYNIRALIIDEISMVRADVFDYIDRLLRFVKGKNVLFGGIQVICVGDFFQLPPVARGPELVQLKQAGYPSPFVFDSFAFREGFITLTLSQVLRQQGDNEFLRILHNARTGEVTLKDVQRLNQQIGETDGLRISLAGTNKLAQDINLSKLNSITEPRHVYDATYFGEWPAMPTEIALALAPGAQVMVKMNGADKPEGVKGGEFVSQVVNGSLGIVRECLDNKALVELESGEQVTIYRRRWERKIKERGEDNSWEERVVASFEQVPLALAWAISMHKSQGQTFDKVHINPSKIFAPGQLYVALSRVRSLAGLSLESPITKNKFWANKDVLRFFRNQKTVAV